VRGLNFIPMFYNSLCCPPLMYPMLRETLSAHDRTTWTAPRPRPERNQPASSTVERRIGSYHLYIKRTRALSSSVN
jgi:hypothetical protein